MTRRPRWRSWTPAFGQSLLVLPRFAPPDGSLVTALGADPALLGATDVALARWRQQLTHVRDGVARFDLALLLAEVVAGAAPLPLRVAQLPPGRATSGWRCRSHPGRAPGRGRLSVVAALTGDVTAGSGPGCTWTAGRNGCRTAARPPASRSTRPSRPPALPPRCCWRPALARGRAGTTRRSRRCSGDPHARPGARGRPQLTDTGGPGAARALLPVQPGGRHRVHPPVAGHDPPSRGGLSRGLGDVVEPGLSPTRATGPCSAACRDRSATRPGSSPGSGRPGNSRGTTPDRRCRP